MQNSLEEEAYLVIHDSKVRPEQIEIDLNKNVLESNLKNKNKSNKFKGGNWDFAEDLSEIFNNADAVVILTEWHIYSKLDWEEIARTMRKPAWVFDTRSIISKEQMDNSSLNFWQVGNGSI